MLKKLKNIFYLGSFFIFIVLITRFYFSDQNIRETNKSRSFYSVELNSNTQNLPLLKNDTSNIIEYIDDIEVYKKKKKKYTFWDLIGK
jgi:protocatechuate 3,4-dioxygenase beta subunit|tara:strand:- start:61 stop:324 length:264 start_codon:yes stop_codon:yes gene_type:complete